MSDKVKVKAFGIVNTFVKDDSGNPTVEIVFDEDGISEVSEKHAKELLNRVGGHYEVVAGKSGISKARAEMSEPSIDRLQFEYDLLVRQKTHLPTLRVWFNEKLAEVEQALLRYQQEMSPEKMVSDVNLGIPTPQTGGGIQPMSSIPQPGDQGTEKVMSVDGIDGMEKSADESLGDDAILSRAKEIIKNRKSRRKAKSGK